MLFGSTAFRFSEGIWQQPEFEHGALLLAVALWLLWREREFVLATEAPSSALAAAILIIPGLILHLLGVRLKAAYFELGSLVPVLAGALYLVGGWQLVGKYAFVLVFVLLATPLPAPLMYAATSGLKEWVSAAAETILHLGGYPVARDGVTLRIGPYNLLMADACSGMNSLISLSALGLLYVYLTARRSPWHLLVLLASILPIAVVTNLMRVLVLTLITYYLGDEAGQGFLHEFAGFVMFLVALAALSLLDVVLRQMFRVLPRGRHVEY